MEKSAKNRPNQTEIIPTHYTELSSRENLTFGLEELFNIYQVGTNVDHGRHYFSYRPEFDELMIENCRPEFNELLIKKLPNFDVRAKDYVVVTENFMFGASKPHTTPVQWEEGTAGLSSLSCLHIALMPSPNYFLIFYAFIFTGIRVVQQLQELVNPNWIKSACAIPVPRREAPTLLGYIPSYTSFLDKN